MHLKADTIKKYADATQGSLCYSDGYIRYSRREGAKVVVFEGAFGTETSRIVRKDAAPVKSEDQGWNTDLSCNRYRPTPPQPLPGMKIALKEGHGFLYFGTDSSLSEKRQPVMYFLEILVKTKSNYPWLDGKCFHLRVIRSDFDNSYLLFGPHRRNETSGVDCVPRS